MFICFHEQTDADVQDGAGLAMLRVASATTIFVLNLYQSIRQQVFFMYKVVVCVCVSYRGIEYTKETRNISTRVRLFLFFSYVKKVTLLQK